MRRRAGGWAVVLVAAACGWTATAKPAAAAERRVFLLGDSVMAGLHFSSAAIAALDTAFDTTLDAKVCRTIREPSCSTQYDGRPPAALSVLRANAGTIGDALVMMAGYNDANIGPGVDAVMAEAAAQGVPHVVWLTYRNLRGRYSASNATLWAKAAEYPTLTVIDWDGYSAGHGDWFGGDGLHLTGAGPMALADFLIGSLRTVFAGDGSAASRQRCAGAAGGGAAPAPTDVAPTTSQASGFTPAGPVRVADTRAIALLGAGLALDVDLSAAVPAGTTAVLVTLTATAPCSAGYLTAYACGTQVPMASNVNYGRGRDRANTALVLVGSDRHLCVYSYATTDVVVDLSGWLAPGRGWRYQPTSPARLVDTRLAGGSKRPADSTLPVTVSAWPGGPLAPIAVLVNVTATDAETPGYVTVSTCGEPTQVSTLNLAPGEVVANVAAAVVGGNGTVCVYTSAAMHVIVDVEGWFGPTGSRLVPQTPQRVVDTRVGRGGARLDAGSTLAVSSSGAGDLVNVTAVGADNAGFLTVHPCGPVPIVSNANYRAGDVVPALAAVGSAGGTFCVTSMSATDLVVDRLATLVP